MFGGVCELYVFFRFTFLVLAGDASKLKSLAVNAVIEENGTA